ncbi:MAG: glycosyltransferase [Myxacorys californica WJT36-NPBG1]|nr:glycosyltransferase [Myxacorys californica WJT36-NPBG1]
MNQLISSFVNSIALVSTLSFLVLSSFLLIECFAAFLPISRRIAKTHHQQHRIAVLVPAHNEEVCLGLTLADLVPQLKPRDQVVVIADNCTDATAEIACKAGATVIERHNLAQVGKGYALDYGLRHLAADPPDVVVLIDADCRVQPDTIAQLTQAAIATGRPAQATYLMEKPAVPSPKDAVSAFAFTVKNLVRPLGLSQLKLPCLLTGTGMAFPWAVIRSVDLANGHLVEDMKLSLDLTITGYAPIYCPEALVIGNLPQQERAARSQRTRWEHGHLQAIRMYVPLLLKAGIEKQRPEAFALALELSIPPLSLFVMGWLGLTIAALVWGTTSALWTAAELMAIAGICLFLAILLAWAKFGRADLPLRQLLSVPFYILWKIPLYFRFLVQPQRAWVRTERDSEGASKQGIVELLDK